MLAPGEKNLPPAGISAADDTEVAALLARLQEEVRKSPAVAASARVAARTQAERLWPVSAERPLQRRPGLKGALLHPVKLVLRRLMRWYVEPLAAEQRAFNDAVLKLIDDLYEQVDQREREP